MIGGYRAETGRDRSKRPNSAGDEGVEARGRRLHVGRPGNTYTHLDRSSGRGNADAIDEGRGSAMTPLADKDDDELERLRQR
ncbi:MAG: hypothetical protein K0U75_14065 [Actinomycetia bacterium]|nr:hypothetical protein [Actinomycetes bacterium]